LTTLWLRVAGVGEAERQVLVERVGLEQALHCLYRLELNTRLR
jgi:hypothetical protein